LERIGITAEDVEDSSPIEVWPDNEMAVGVFCAMSNQWRHGMNGPTGLVYSELETVLRWMGLEVEDKPQFFHDIQTLERAALEQISSNQESARR